MTATDILQELETMGSEPIRRILKNHGAPEAVLGVKIGDMKTIVKRVKKNHALSLALFDTGVPDAMYLAGLIADEKKIAPDELREWADQASWYMISGYTVPWVAAESPHGWMLGLEWIDSVHEHTAATGWNTLAGWVVMKPDSELDLPLLEKLLDRIGNTLHASQNWVRHAMNGFLIAVGGSVIPVSDKAIAIAQKVGKVQVNQGNTDCKVPDAVQYIEKIKSAGKLGAKRKMVRC